MRYFYAGAHLCASDTNSLSARKAKKKAARGEGGRPKSPYSDELVISILIEHLKGSSINYLSHTHGISNNLLRQWTKGTVRGKLIDKAEAIYRKELGDSL